MKALTSAEVRQLFLDYFVEMGHRNVGSSSLVPANDPTLLFANSGMVQFKDVFLGKDMRDYKRATTAQKSMRVSGKHNDLENVGPSPRHHTFFEMLGNFSFGDYFKREAIHYAWNLITKVFEMPVNRLAVTVYERDDEAYDIWTKEIGLPPSRVARLGAKTNFWQMAETGPCGPCSEIFWDRTPELGEDGIIQSFLDDDDRMLEFWNLVFMQFNRKAADPLNTGEHDEPLPNPCVDTGMGLERIVSILQGKTANYDTDLFTPIIAATQALTGDTDAQVAANFVPYRVIADHIRAAVFLISDGVLPGAKGRDAVCRLVIRRAARFGRKLGFTQPFLGTVAQSVIDIMGHHYTELVDKAAAIRQAITTEEERFLVTLEVGLNALDEMLKALPPGGTLSGSDAFYLKATLGLPIQVTKDICEERGYHVDEAGFAAAEDDHSVISGGGQAMGRMDSAEFYSALFNQLVQEQLLPASGVDYAPYDDEPVNTQVVALVQDGQWVNNAIVGEKVEIVLAQTNFYVESGGQVSDTGVLLGDGWLIQVEHMKRPVTGLVVHVGEVLEGNPKDGDAVRATVALDRRKDIIRNHTGTHLLHAALRNQLGTTVQQRGSLVAPDRLRFDFSYDKKVSREELKAIETEINQAILQSYAVTTAITTLDEARAEGAMALFGEKYGDTVRTVSIGDNHGRYSYELCGGVHVRETGQIGTFVFVSEGSVSAGIRRVEALTGRGAVAYIQDQLAALHDLNALLGPGENAVAKVEHLQEELAQSRRQLAALQSRLAKARFDELLTQVEQINGKSALIAQLDNVNAETMREMADWFRNRYSSGAVIVLGASIEGKPALLVGVSDDLIQKGIRAGDLIKPIAAVVGGSGGGRPNLAQAGGKDSNLLPQALQKARELLSS
jgi:alanyl-tRNA synthetase